MAAYFGFSLFFTLFFITLVGSEISQRNEGAEPSKVMAGVFIQLCALTAAALFLYFGMAELENLIK